MITAMQVRPRRRQDNDPGGRTRRRRCGCRCARSGKPKGRCEADKYRGCKGCYDSAGRGNRRQTSESGASNSPGSLVAQRIACAAGVRESPTWQCGNRQHRVTLTALRPTLRTTMDDGQPVGRGYSCYVRQSRGGRPVALRTRPARSAHLPQRGRYPPGGAVRLLRGHSPPGGRHRSRPIIAGGDTFRRGAHGPRMRDSVR
jgi:hypothetical protein